MKKIVALIFMALVSFVAVAHSGGTDRNGCHNDHKTGDYHCH